MGWRFGEANGAEFVAVAREDHDADAEASFGVVHGFEDFGAFGEKAAPGVGGAEAPILGEGDGGGDDFPVDVLGFGSSEEGQKGVELGGSEDGGVWVRLERIEGEG